MSADIKNCPGLRISERRSLSEQFPHFVEKSIFHGTEHVRDQTMTETTRHRLRL